MLGLIYWLGQEKTGDVGLLVFIGGMSLAGASLSSRGGEVCELRMDRPAQPGEARDLGAEAAAPGRN